MTKKIKKKIVRIVIGLAIMIAGYILTDIVSELTDLLIFIAAYAIVAYDIVIKCFKSFINGFSAKGNFFGKNFLDENFLMTVATIGAFFCGENSEAVAVMLFYQIGECFQSVAVNKSRKSIKTLMSIRPDFARVVRNGVEAEIEPENVEIGELIRIKPGERIPLDGIITEGVSSLDTSAITGESIPRECSANDTVVSGCVNLSGALTVKVNAAFAESTVSRILNLVEDASSKKAKSEQFITKFAKYYTPIIVALALLLAVLGSIVTSDIRTWVYRAMTFLLISCPCALVISIPLSFFGGIGGAGRRGILIKGGEYMETLAQIDTFVFDKTGTLTKGNFAIAGIFPTERFVGTYGNDARARILNMAAISEYYSNHPIAVSLVKASKVNASDVLDVKITEVAGRGIAAVKEGTTICVGNFKLMQERLSQASLDEFKTCLREDIADAPETCIYVAVDDTAAGIICIADEVKDNAENALQNLKRNFASRIYMLTGDNGRTAGMIARKLGIDEYFASLSPLDKVAKLENIMASEKAGKVAFVGDGINDAPVLSRADIGIAMGAMGSDAAIEAADVVIMTDDLDKLYEAKAISRRTLMIVRENIVLALSVKLVVLLLAALGIAHMNAAIFADVGVAFLAITNAMRALNYR